MLNGRAISKPRTCLIVGIIVLICLLPIADWRSDCVAKLVSTTCVSGWVVPALAHPLTQVVLTNNGDQQFFTLLAAPGL